MSPSSQDKHDNLSAQDRKLRCDGASLFMLQQVVHHISHRPSNLCHTEACWANSGSNAASTPACSSPSSQDNQGLQGWEDLRLDERLMQVVTHFSSPLQSDPSTARRQLFPKPLSITPLGPSMGLIQWVDHTMPLYGVYKAWQQRQMADKAGAYMLYHLGWSV